MKKILYFASAMTLMLASCSTNNDIECLTPETIDTSEARVITLSAKAESSAATRVNYTQAGDFFWTENDTIAVYNTYGKFSKFTVNAEDAGKADASFTGTITGSTCDCAVYPASAVKDVPVRNMITLLLPSSYAYKYIQTDFPTDMTAAVNSTNMTMIAKIANVGDTDFTFKSVGGVLCFKFKNVPASTSKAVFSCNNRVSGYFDIKLGGETPTMTTEDISLITDPEAQVYKTVTVTFPALEEKSDLVVYIPVPCGTYEGFKIELFDDADVLTAWRETSKTKTVNRAEALRFNDVELNYTINGHYFVDLGLPSGLKWATCNVGASEPVEYGYRYSWGSTSSSARYNESDCATYHREISDLRSSGVIDANRNLTPEYDAATVNWGSPWRMPTEAEVKELVENCTFLYINEVDVKGCKVTGKNGNSIFLPAAGHMEGSTGINIGNSGFYWTATATQNSSTMSCYLLFTSLGADYNDLSRYYGGSVRAVSE